MSYAIVYATKSKVIRRVIADDDGQIFLGTTQQGGTAVICSHRDVPDTIFPLMRGESAHIVSVGNSHHMPHHWKDTIHAHTGTYPPDITCALIDDAGVVQHVVHADPDVDPAPLGFSMVVCDHKVIVGDTYDSETQQFHRVPR